MNKNELGGVIAKKLILRILLCSSLITLLFTSWQLYSDYRIGRNHILETLDEIENSHVNTISRSVWTSDRNQLTVQLDGILQLHEMQYVKVSFENYNLEAGVPQQENVISRQIPLSYNFNNEEHKLGTLYLVATLQNVYSRLFDKALFIFLTQGIKTFLVSTFIFFIFQILVTRHLSVIAHYAKNLTFENLGVPLSIKRTNLKGNKADELEIVANAINDMRLNLSAEIEEHEKDKEKIKSSLKEKETLLQEIHHRVKNNMQVIAGLLNLKAESSENEQVKQSLKDSQNRVYAMSAVHETIYSSGNLAEIDLNEYISKITNMLTQAYVIDLNQISCRTESDDIKISIEQASPLGLVINELVSNSLIHAFPNGKTGKIFIKLRKLNPEDIEVTVMDNGIGLPTDFNWQENSNLGLQLVKGLVENQLDGHVEATENGGVQFLIKFKLI
jgi:two-component sensor histidine kinase